jgi:hypothetical protein
MRKTTITSKDSTFHLALLYETTEAQLDNLERIEEHMVQAGFSETFIEDAIKFAVRDQGVYELLDLWDMTGDPHERDSIIFDVVNLLYPHGV